MLEDALEVYIDEFSVVGDIIDDCLLNLTRALLRCEEANLFGAFWDMPVALGISSRTSKKSHTPCVSSWRRSLKEKLVLPTIIVGQNWAKPFGIECDANGTTLGALLDHKRNKMFHLFYYASKSLNGAEENYTISEHELLALIYALEKFRAYLVGTKDRQGLENQVAVQLSKSGAARKEHSFIPALEFVLTFKFVYMPF
ncbi:uncharacterized protein [Solanum lycopersicum]|uniref:uncharacterized protein n=1 Tax=Solanum lycopersicum TaxID=4081 RepID=UPI003749F7A7